MPKNFALPFDYLPFGGGPGGIGAQILVTDDGVNGQRIWSINDAGIPTLLESVNPGLDDTGSALDPGPLGLISSNSADVAATSLYTIYSATLGQQLWATDGTPAGTRLVLNLDPGLGTRNQEFSFSQPNNAVFVTDDGVHGQKLWFTDGTTGGTTLLTTVDTGVEPTGSEFELRRNRILTYERTIYRPLSIRLGRRDSWAATLGVRRNDNRHSCCQ